MRRTLCTFLLMALLTPSFAFGQTPATTFYFNLLEKGKASFQTGAYAGAVKELRIAAFGLMDTLPHYQTAQIYLALAYERLGNRARARDAIVKVLDAERIAPTYGALTIDPALRPTFEGLAAGVLTPEEMKSVPAFANLGRPVAARPSNLEALRRLFEANPKSIPVALALAEANLRAGNVSDAKRLAAEVLNREPSNATARAIAQIAEGSR